MEIFMIEETDSTNSWVADNRSQLPIPCMVYARMQTAGRGQRGNHWESEPGKNLCASFLLQPDGVAPGRQFVISEAVALAVTDLLESCGVEAAVKWPNDIYAGDRKICGILIEHSVMPDRILHTIAGVGINLNQEKFLSDAPNPVSLIELTGIPCDVGEMARKLSASVERRMMMTVSSPEGLHREFRGKMWRGGGKKYPFIDRIRGERIEARIAGVAPEGLLLLDTGDDIRKYAFKEVEFVL